MSVHPRKSLSQNFLTDTPTQKRIAESLTLKESSVLLEIGPGMGALTQHLVKFPVKSLFLVEYDLRCVEFLTQNFINHNHTHLFHADILDFDWASLPNDPLHIIGNIPYHITSPLLIHCIKAPMLQEAVFMVQTEVAQRIIAKPNSKAYGRLSIILQLYTEPSLLFHVQAEHFSPQPKVNSSVIHFKPTGFAPTKEELQALSTLTNICFQQRRKKISNTLKSTYPHYQDALKALDINSSARPENLTPEEFYTLSQTLVKHS